jgi:dTDP-4-amino-4,6-dideoxygalactose transaminase
MKNNPQKIVEWFEEEVADYTGAPFAVSCDNCTNAIRMCCRLLKVKEVTIPLRTYVSVPQSILQAGGTLKFENIEWSGIYQLKPYPIYDAAKRFTSGMYIKGTLMCLSFGIRKHLKLGKGGVILTDNQEYVKELKKMRWSGRQEKVSIFEDSIDEDGWNSYITPEQAARGLMLLSVFPKDTEDQPEIPPYRALNEFRIFKDVPVKI